jgi:hypothetical protein
LIELIKTECEALFVTLQHADFIEGDPKKRLAWVLAGNKAMHGQLTKIFFGSGLTDDSDVEKTLCDCIKRMQSWVAANPDVKARMDKDQVDAGMTWSQYLAITRAARGGCP